MPSTYSDTDLTRLHEARDDDLTRLRLALLRKKYAEDWLLRSCWRWFATGVANDADPDPQRLRKALGHAINVAHRARFGSRWSGPKYRDRHVDGLYVIEGLWTCNRHIHAALIYETDDLAAFEHSMNVGWKRHIPAGDIRIDPFDINMKKHNEYIIKEVYSREAEELIGFVRDL